MSRLIVKGLPKRYDEDSISKLFGKVGEVTDAKVMRTPSGQSRMFAYIGFRTTKEAGQAILKFNKTFIGAARISVEVAKSIGDSSIPRPWSKYSKGSSRFTEHARRKQEQNTNKITKKRKRSELAENKTQEEEDPRYRIFKDLMTPRKSKNLWSDSSEMNISPGNENLKKKPRESVARQEGFNTSPGMGVDESIPKCSFEGVHQRHEVEDLKYQPGDRTHKKPASSKLSDLDYIKSKIRPNLGDESDGDASASSSEDGQNHQAFGDLREAGSRSEGEKESPSKPRREKSALQSLGDIEGNELADVTETGRLFVRNLAYSVKEEDLEELFEPFGALAEVHLVVDASTKKSRGIAFILYVIPEDAAAAMAALDGKSFAGRLLHILPGRERPQNMPLKVSQPGSGVSTGFQREREKSKKEAAKNKTDLNVYNALFMSSDAVAGVLADRYGVRKSTMYGTEQGESGSAAVRVAAGEAQLQAETRAFFSAEGIELDSLEDTYGKKNLSKKAFLIKNLPARTQKTDLEEKFLRFGEVKRLVIAPSGLLAVIEYVEGSSAKRAYASTAYTRMKDAPMYLEWLPERSLRDSYGSQKEPLRDTDDADWEKPTKELEDVPYGHASANSVFVKNLNFDTTDSSLRNTLRIALKKEPEVIAALRSVVVSTRPDPKDPKGRRLSNGYGFLEFATPETAADAVRLAQGARVDGFTVELKLSSKGAAAGHGQTTQRKHCRHKPSSKLVVKNVPFEATTKDLRALFATFGQVKSLRMPRKFDGSSRGFAFVEFVSKNEAAGALKALSEAHLYGRRLVLDFADTSNENGFTSIHEMMDKAQKQALVRGRVLAEGLHDGRDDNDDDERMRDELYSRR